MAKRITDADFVVSILESMRGKSNRLLADAIVKKLGFRIRNRARTRAAEDVNQAAARVVREATERD
jgi:hypothetical protein